MLEPKVIVADEPVSALDVSIRSQVLNLMKRLQAEHQRASVVISHDLAVVKYLADRIAVMYLGKVVELGTGDDIYRRPAHPYTDALIKTIPVPDPPPSARRPRWVSAASFPARSIPRPAAASERAARARRNYAPRRSRSCARSDRRIRPPAISRFGNPPGPRPPARSPRDLHRIQDERLDLRLVAKLAAAARGPAVGSDAELRPKQQARARGVCCPEPRHPLGGLVDHHPGIVHRTGHQQRRPPAGRRILVGRVGPHAGIVVGARGSPHSSHSLAVSGIEASSMVFTQSTNGTSATTARHRSGRIEYDRALEQPAGRRPPGHDPAAVHQRRLGAAGQPVGDREKVRERRWLGLQSALLPPLPPAFAAAADVGDRVDDSAVQQRGQAAVKLRIEAVLVGAVAVQQARRAAVQGDIFPAGQRDRDRRAVRCRGRHDARCGTGPDRNRGPPSA